MKKLLIALAVCSSSYAMAQDSSTKNWKSGDEATHFIKKAARVDMMEIKAGKMAQEKSTNSGVKSYGEMIVRDHTKSWTELKAIADRRNVQLPAMDNSNMNANMGASSGTWMGTSSSSYLSGEAANTARAGENRSRVKGTANMRLSKAQTTPSKRFYSGQATGWTDKDVAAGTTSTTWSYSDGSTNPETMSAAAGTSSATSTQSWSNTSSAATVPASSTTRTTSQEPGVVSDGTLGVSGTTGTLNTNAAFNGASMGTDSTSAMGTSMNTQSSAAGTGTATSSAMGAEPNWSDMDRDHQSKLESLKGKTGAEFDRAYINMMTSDHGQAIQLYEKASMSSDAEIKAFATKMLPILKQHQEAAKNLMNSTNSGM